MSTRTGRVVILNGASIAGKSTLAAARSGFDVVVDEVTFDSDAAGEWDDALHGLPVTWVGVRCDPDIADARERARGDRVVGVARGLTAKVHDLRTYDLELDSGAEQPAALVAKLEELLRAREAQM